MARIRAILATLAFLAGFSAAQGVTPDMAGKKAPNRSVLIPDEVWIASRTSGVVRRFDLDGNEVGQTPVGTDVVGLAFDGLGNVWITRRGSESGIYKCDSKGELVLSIPMTGSPTAIAAGRDGIIWAVKDSPHELLRMEQDGSITRRIPLPGRSLGVAIDWFYRVYVSLYGDTAKVLRFDRRGEHKATIDVDKGAWSLTSSICCMWVVDQMACKLDCIGRKDFVKRSIHLPGFPRDAAVDGDADVWVCMPDQDRVLRYSTAGEFKQSIPVGSRPKNISIDGRGQAWVTNWDDGTVTRISRDGVPLQTIDVGPEPSAWCNSTGFAYTNATDPREDHDGDGYANHAEVIARSNPMDRQDIPADIEFLSAPVPGTNLNVRFTDYHNPGARYVAYLTYTLSPNWAFQECLPCDPRLAVVNTRDPLFNYTIGRLPGFKGVLDPTRGQATASVAIPPNFPIHTDLYIGFVTVDPAAGHIAIRTMSLPKLIDFSSSLVGEPTEERDQAEPEPTPTPSPGR